MSLLALILIIISAFMHATWNYLAKRSQGGLAFVWLYMAVSTVIYAPFVIGMFIWQPFHIGWVGWAFIIGSAVIHLVYALTLQKGYKIGDLSLVYPVARGTGPLIVAVAAVFIYAETLTPLSMIGIILITISIFIITGGVQALKQKSAFVPLLYGLLIGILIASYTLVDKGAVSIAHIPPLLLTYGGMIGQLLFLTPFAVRRWNDVRYDWQYHRKEAIGVGILMQLAYILVLTAMTFTQVSHVAPVREMSILIGTVMGTRLLAEGFGRRRIISAIIMVLGVIAVALADG